MPVFTPPERRWDCPNCPAVEITRIHGPHIRYHVCRGLRGLTAPMVPAGTKAKVTTREREDYIGGDLVQVDGEGRPVMSILVTRDDGQDVTVLAPCATTRSQT